MNVAVNGIGNIGTTLLSLLAKFKEDLGIEQIYALKHTLSPWNEDDLSFLSEKNIRIATYSNNSKYDSVEDCISSINYIFDCTANGFGLKNKKRYETLPHLKGASAQGSEKHFGTPFMSGVNDKQIEGEKFVQIVSCNTHSLASILQTFTGKDLGNLKAADFVIVRRSEDIGNHQRLVSANVVARHLDKDLGTHHSIDVIDLFTTVGIFCPVTSSDITTPSQMMHGVRFSIELKEPLKKDILTLISENPAISSTKKFDSNVIFELGRRYGVSGRIFSHAILIDNNFLLTDYSIKGWAFIPQEGNTLLSTLHAFLLQMQANDIEGKMNLIRKKLLRKVW